MTDIAKHRLKVAGLLLPLLASTLAGVGYWGYAVVAGLTRIETKADALLDRQHLGEQDHRRLVETVQDHDRQLHANTFRLDRLERISFHTPRRATPDAE